MTGKALTHLHETLIETGAPLDALVANDCRRFAAVYGDSKISVDSARVVYGGREGDAPLREIDRCVTIYEEIEVGERVGIQLNLQVVIEVKHRKGLHGFGFAVDQAEEIPTPIIMAGDLAHSEALRTAAMSPVNGLPSTTREIALIVDRNGSPKRSEEQLLFKSSSSTLDFVRSDLPESSIHDIEAAFASIGVLAQVDKYVQDSRHDPLFSARKWAHDHNLRQHAGAFADAFQGPGMLYHLVDVYCPTVCLDAPLWSVDVTADGEIGEIESADLLLASVRTSGWPHEVRRAAPMIGPQATIVVTNRAGLQRLLPALFEWFVEASTAIRRAESGEILVDAAFNTLTARRWGRDVAPYRSDLDMTHRSWPSNHQLGPRMSKDHEKPPIR